MPLAKKRKQRAGMLIYRYMWVLKPLVIALHVMRAAFPLACKPQSGIAVMAFVSTCLF
jgi:hypothetical protein